MGTETIALLVDQLSRYPLVLFILSLLVWWRPHQAAYWLGAAFVCLSIWGLYVHQDELFAFYYDVLRNNNAMPAAYQGEESARSAFKILSLALGLVALAVPWIRFRQRGKGG